MYQSTLDYFLEAWTESPKCIPICYPRVQQFSANSLCLLKQYFFLCLDAMVATAMERGPSMDDDQWAQATAAQKEYKVSQRL